MGDLGRYDIILGIPYMTKYGLNLLFDSNMIQWDGMMTPMRTWKKDVIPILKDVDESRAQTILDSKYKKQDIFIEQQAVLTRLLKKYESLFSGQLGVWPGEKIEVELMPDAKPYHCGKAMHIPHIHYETLNKDRSH
jgi:hypothetical protein